MTKLRGMESKLDVGGTLREVFSTYGANAGILLPVAFCIFLLVGVLEWAVGGSLLLFPLAMIVNIAAGTLYQGMVVGLVRDIQDGRRDVSVMDLVKSATPVILPLLGAGILAGLGIGLGFVFLVVPGLILATIWSVIAPVIVVERVSAMGSFERSRELVRGNGWRVFWVILLAMAIVFAVSILVGAVAVAIADTALSLILASILAVTATAPISALVAAVLYFRLKAIEDLARPAQFEPPPASSPPPPPPPPPLPTPS